MSNYVIAIYVSFGSWHVHGSHSVYLPKSGVTVASGTHEAAPGPSGGMHEGLGRGRARGAQGPPPGAEQGVPRGQTVAPSGAARGAAGRPPGVRRGAGEEPPGGAATGLWGAPRQAAEGSRWWGPLGARGEPPGVPRGRRRGTRRGSRGARGGGRRGRLSGARAEATRGHARRARTGEGGRGGGGEEGEGRGAHLGVQIRQSPSPNPRAQRGRERWRRGGFYVGKSNERKGEKGERHAGEGQGTCARAGPGWAWPHRGSNNPAARTTTDRNPIREMKTETRLGKHAIRHDIIQKKYDST
jgi:hypothetical protein